MIKRREFLVGAGAALALCATRADAMLSPEGDALSGLVDLDGINGPGLMPRDLAVRPVLITFWASWCPPCRDEFRHFNHIQDHYAGTDLLVLGVNVFEDFGGPSTPAKRARFLRQTGPAFRLLQGTPKTREAFGGISRIPTVMLFDSHGELTYQFVHERDATKMHTTFGELKPIIDMVVGS